MFQWSKKVVKSVTFNPEVADESLLSLVESHLEPELEKTFSDLCKEALWQFLCVPESVKPGSKTIAAESVEQKIDELHRQVADLEERFFAKEYNRFGGDGNAIFLQLYATNGASSNFGNRTPDDSPPASNFTSSSASYGKG